MLKCFFLCARSNNGLNPLWQWHPSVDDYSAYANAVFLDTDDIGLRATARRTMCTRSARYSSVVTLARPASSSSLKITDRSFRYASPCLWNQLPFSLRKPNSGTSFSISCSPIPSPITSSSDSPLFTSITPSLSLPA